MSDARPERGRFRSAMLWNFSSLAVLGVSGIALNVLIARYYDAATLGVFNQSLAVYIFFSQLAVGGIDRSALKCVAEHAGDRRAVSSIVIGSFAPTLLLASLASVAFFFSRGLIASWLESPATAAGIAAATPGLFFFALNKVGLAVVNGVQRMRAFAVYTALRYLLILLGLFGFVVFDADRAHGAQLAVVFSFAEGLLFLVLCFEVARQIDFGAAGAWRAWSRTHMRYGLKSIASGVLLELNARVDVLMIGHFMSDDDVGVYTFAGMIAEGVYQLLVVLQNLYNPILAREIAARRMDELHATIARGKRWTYAGMAAAGALAVVLYPFALSVLTDKPGFAASEVPFRWLILGIVLAAGYIPFGQTLLMAGFPGWHTGYMVLTVMFNVVGNWFLIQSHGLTGAAISTANSMFLGVFVLSAFVKRKVGLRL